MKAGLRRAALPHPSLQIPLPPSSLRGCPAALITTVERAGGDLRIFPSVINSMRFIFWQHGKPPGRKRGSRRAGWGAGSGGRVKRAGNNPPAAAAPQRGKCFDANRVWLIWKLPGQSRAALCPAVQPSAVSCPLPGHPPSTQPPPGGMSISGPTLYRRRWGCSQTPSAHSLPLWAVPWVCP